MVDSRQADILRTHDIDTGISAEQASQQIIVEVLAGQPA
jgi:hypothetical protein